MKTKNNLFDLGVITAQIFTASVITINERSKMMLTENPFSPKVLNEHRRMVVEKVSVGLHLGSTVSKSAMELCDGNFNPVQSWHRLLNPIHKTTVDNARRLTES